MQYYAKTNTASPAIGFISVGMMLTEKQADALGDDLIAELLERGVLGVFEDHPTRAAASNTDVDSADGFNDSSEASLEDAPEVNQDNDGEEDEEPAELEIDSIDEIIEDQKPEDSTEKPKKSGKGKKK